MLNRIVVWDPDLEFWEGSLVDPVKERIINMRGGATLPCDPGLFQKSGVGGFMKRSWGAGWPLDFVVPKRCCPLTLFVPTSHRAVHWAVRLVPSPSVAQAALEGNSIGEGMLRLVGDTGQLSTPGIAVTPEDAGVEVRKLGKMDSRGGWTFRGNVIAHPGSDTHYGFSLYGAAPGLRVAWAAISATEASAG